MFDSRETPSLVAVLRARDASLWHACQLTDLAAHLRLGAISPPAVLERAGHDLADAASGASEHLRASLADAGRAFALGERLLPDGGGPIVLQLHPRALLRAGGVDVVRGGHHLATPGEIDDAFAAPVRDGFPASAEVRGGREADAVLVSPRGIGFEDVVVAWVDPVVVGEMQLIDRVEALADAAGIPLRVRRRTSVLSERLLVWRDLAHVLADGPLPLLGIWQRADTSPSFRSWAGELRAKGLDAPFARLVQALDHGTLIPLRHQLPAGAGDRVRAAVGTPGAFPPPPRAASVYACGHPVMEWDAGTCHACLAGYRSRWRYPAS